MFLFITMFGIASAMQPIAAYNMGAKDFKRLSLVMKKTRKYAFITSTLMWILGLIFAPAIISIFIRDKEIIRESVVAFRIMISAFPLISIYYLSIFYFQAQGKARKSIMVSIFRQLIIMLPLSIIMVKVFKLGAMGVWLSYPIADILASLIAYILVWRETKEIKIKVQKQIASSH